MIRAFEIRIRGVVQGVGFRPFVFRLAHKHSLSGWVRNTSGDVEVQVEGPEEALASFVRELRTEAPVIARIAEVKITEIHPNSYRGFAIKESLSEPDRYQPVSADIAICSDCTEEVFSPKDRRYRYPFTNCTNCGPRFTIIEDIPYDRQLTTMRRFTMCPDCQKEYNDPLNRRFHAQPNACPKCGPALELRDDLGKVIPCSDAIQKSGGLLRDGKILAIKGLGGFQLACDATNTEAVKLLRLRKKRPSKPFALMMASLDDIKTYCSVTEEEQKLLVSPQSPIVLLRCKTKALNAFPGVSPELLYLGVMLPYTALHHLLMKEVSFPLVMTSGNLSEEPIAGDNDEALRRLSGIADYFLTHNRDIYSRYDDSVYAFEGGIRPIRRARGYAPYPLTMPFEMRQVLACGAEEKNTFCLTRDSFAFVSQHIGDMENLETLEHFEKTLALYKKLFRIQPEVIACDMHPEYLATKYALSLKDQKPELLLIPVQHHHAHIASCMAENGISSPVIGVAFDGTGYGATGDIWGGEFLVCDYKGFKRVGHLEYVPMPGGTVAIKKPYRMALGYIHSLIGKDVSLAGLPIVKSCETQELELITRQIEKRINSPLTSSMGRLFEAVSAITGICQVNEYEAQAAALLEMAATSEMEKGGFEPYPFSVDNGDCKIIKLGELITAIVNDVNGGVPSQAIAARFHETIVEIIVRMVRQVSEETGIRTIALSGGVFQNRIILRLVTERLKTHGFDVLTHHFVPCNDGGLSLGQAVIGSFISENGGSDVSCHTGTG